jgi:stage III sporulation protein AB
VKELENVLIFLDKLKTCLSYQNLPTDEMIDDLAEDPSCKSLPYLNLCRELLANQTDFPTAWKMAIERSSGKTNLNHHDTSYLLSLSGIIGSSDVDGQLSAISMVEELLRRQRAEAQEAKEKKGKLYRSLGALAGAGMVIILF